MAQDSRGRLRVHTLDVSNPRSVAAFAAEVGQGQPVDVLINNAGVFGKNEPLGRLDFEDVEKTLTTNALGPLRVSSALLPALRRGEARRIVHITSILGSIGDNAMGGYYGYRLSKAALNMGMRNMHMELRGEGFVTIGINPGWVQTDMGGPQAPLRPEESVHAMLQVIDGLSVEQSGRFFNYDGSEIPW